MTLPGEPAGLVVTRTAGRMAFEATLSWRNRDETPERDGIPSLSSAEYRRSITETDAPDAASREIHGEVLAFDVGTLARLLEETLRNVMRAAAFSEAVLEIRTVRTASPVVSVPHAVEGLARELQSAGHRVRFGRSWNCGVPPDAAVCVGTGGDGRIEELLQKRPAYTLAEPGR